MNVRVLTRAVTRLLTSPTLIFNAALSTRVGVLWHLLPAYASRGFYEQNEAARVAWCMVSGFGFSSPWPHTTLAPTAQQPPVYPWLLAGIFSIFGPYSYTSLWIAVLLNAVFSATTALIIYRVALRDFGRPTALIASWAWACWIYEAVVSIRLWESSLSALLLVSSMLLLPVKGENPGTKKWAVLGTLFGVGILTNTTLSIVFVGFWIGLWRTPARKGSFRRGLLLSVAACVLVLLPWTIRNYVTFHRLIPVRDNLGMELWIGNNEAVTYLFEFRGGFPLLDPAEYNRLGEIAFMEAKRNAAMEFIRRNPFKFLHLSAQRFFYYWTAPARSAWFSLSIISWMGAALAWNRKGSAAWSYAIVLTFFPLIYYITHPWSTYRHPTEPVMIILASYVLVSVASTITHWARRPT
jgi:4-amino-4-deoxy-L-arabinose transferase-like glycosyltransferase